MADIDYARAWQKLQAHVVSKSSHGRDELCTMIVRLETECTVPEGQEGFSDLPAAQAVPTHIGAPSQVPPPVVPDGQPDQPSSDEGVTNGSTHSSRVRAAA